MNHSRRTHLQWGMGCLAASLALPTPARQPDLVWRQRAMIGFGTRLWLNAGHANAERLEQALDQSVQAIRQIERELSLFDPDSALSRLNRHGQLKQAPAHLLTVLRHAQQVSRRSGGALDVSIQPLWDLWSRASAQGERPSTQALQRACARVNWRAIELRGRDVLLNQTNMAVSLNGLGQGYAADVVRQMLWSHGVRDALIDTGESFPLGHNAQGSPWTLGIETLTSNVKRAPQLRPLACDARAVATSSDAHTAFSSDHRDHHIFDPRSGRSPTHWASVTLLAPSALQADALTKVGFQTPAQQLQSFARAWGVDVVAQDKQGHWHSTLTRFDRS